MTTFDDLRVQMCNLIEERVVSLYGKLLKGEYKKLTTEEQKKQFLGHLLQPDRYQIARLIKVRHHLNCDELSII